MNKMQIKFHFASHNCLLGFLIIGCFFFAACNKSPKKIYVSGKAIDATTSLPIENAHLVVGNYEATGTGYSVTAIDEVYTGAAGFYQFEIKNSSGSEFHIAGKANKYFDTDIYENVIPDNKHVNNFDILFTPIGYLKLIYNKADTSYSNLVIEFIGNYSINYNLVMGGGNPDSRFVVIESRGNQNNMISYRVVKYQQGIVIFNQVENLSIYCSANDTTNQILNY